MQNIPKSFATSAFFRNFAPRKHCLGLSLTLLVVECERKVRAAQGAPLLKVEAIGDSR